MKKYKKYISVIELRAKDGTLKPLQIIWDDCRRFGITKAEYNGFVMRNQLHTNRKG